MPSAFHTSGKRSCELTLHAAQEKGEFKSTSRIRDCQGTSQQAQTATSCSSPSRTAESDATQRPVYFPHEGDAEASRFSGVFARVESVLLNNIRTVSSDPSARLVAVSTADKEIDAARQFFYSLLTRRNALLPISLLPPEILALVFHFHSLEEPPRFGKHLGHLGWIRATHVCRYWRQVALRDSSLWARISGIPTNTKWISEMLARAKNAPLDIEFHANAEALLMISPHLSHTRQLRFHIMSTLHHSNSVREIYSREAPALEHFELTFTAYPHITLQDFGGDTLFKGQAPRLRTLSLSGIVIPWSLIPRGQLTQLKIAYLNEDVDSPGDLNQLIDLLVNCPALEILALDGCLPSQLTEFPHGQTIRLHHLSHLHLRGSTSRIMNMLKMLKLPSSTALHLDCISDTTSIHNDSEGLLLPVISAQFQSPAPVEFKSLTIQRHNTSLNTRSLNITASTFPSTLRNRQTQNFKDDIVGNAELVLSFDRLKPRRSIGLLKQACKMLPISNLEFVSMSATDIFHPNWVKLFGGCTNVTTMQAIGHGASSLVRALTAPMVINTGSSKEGSNQKHDKRESTLVRPTSTVAHAHAAIFPKLKILGLTEQDFDDPSGILFDVFERGLQQRMAAFGAPLKLLCISDCKISTEQANDLQEIVQDFQWDGNEGLSDAPEDSDDYEESLYDYAGPFVGHGTAWPWCRWDDDSDGW